jgi:folate-binding protein YgfZ
MRRRFAILAASRLPDTRVSLPAPAELIELAGPDAEKFAQAQFCNDVTALAPGASQLNAWLNPQGRVRRLFHLLRAGETRYLLLLRGGDAASILPTLRMFVLRLKLQVQALSGWHWAETATAEASDETFVLALPQGRTLQLQREKEVSGGLPWAETLARDIDAGLPWLPDHALEQLLPSWMGFARLRAISHDKGCYPGQEIVARLHFRGGGDKRVPVCLATETALHDASDLRDEAGGEAGLLLQSVPTGSGGWRALAIVRRELAEPGTSLRAGDAIVKTLPAPW